MDLMCNFCLCRRPDISLENKILRAKVDQVFYFEIFRRHDDTAMICTTCKDTVVQFYAYAEQVNRNQQTLRLTGLPSTSGHDATQREADGTLVKLECSLVDDHEEYETEWVDVMEKLETSIHQESSMEEDSKSQIKRRHDSDSESENEQDDDTTGDGEWEAPAVEEDTGETSPKPKLKRKYTRRKVTPVRPSVQKKNSTQYADESYSEESVLQNFNLVCDLCSKPLEDFNELREHFKEAHGQQGYIKCCDKKIFKKCWMIEHLQVHLNPDTFHCDICNKSYSSKRVLNDHNKEVHASEEQRALKCEGCTKRFASKRHLNAHMSMAHGSFPCPQCPRTLASQGSLKHHILTIHGEGEQFICDICARVYRTKRCLETHVKGHLGTRQEDKVQCTVCAVWFTNKYQLTKHMNRIHILPEQMLECTLCGKQLRNREALNGHMHRAHTENRFECEFCAKTFKRPHHMREHVAIHHTGEDLYGCNYCDERFNSKNKQYTHRKNVHPVEFEEEMRRRIMKD
ncbi:transcription factor grauzone-like [Sabethes cyaneus]|uniref:transcription factor grauzone-like n=1 Tax=Sabethes cyaneus TaxID=53552 RepID=UPI00237E2E94|nr:transcription factor grauzone-like [Sabethes cyaneus]